MIQYTKGCSALQELNFKPARKGNKTILACQMTSEYEIFDNAGLPVLVGHKYSYLIQDKDGHLFIILQKVFQQKWHFVEQIKVVTPGHIYELPNFEQPQETGQIIYFIQKIKDPDDPYRLVTINDGTTNEAVVKMLIDRL